jgi:RNA polymerase sigma-70 factor, ECF subfamily
MISTLPAPSTPLQLPPTPAAVSPVKRKPQTLEAIAEAPAVESKADTDADAPLVERARQGCQDAFTELVNRHYKNSLKLARSILRDQEDAEDEVQNAYTKAYLNLARFEGNSRFSTWLSRIVVNQCLMRLRKLRRAKFTYIDDPGLEEDGPRLELRDVADDPETAFSRAEIAGLVQQEVNRIPALLREPLLLRESQRLSLAEVAEELDISEAAAKSRLLRARRELKARLVRHCGETSAVALAA